MKDQINNLLDELSTAIQSGKPEEIEQTIKRIQEAFDSYHEFYKKGFSDFDENLKKKFHPINLLSEKIESLELKLDTSVEEIYIKQKEQSHDLTKKIDFNFEEDKKTREFVENNQKFIEDNKSNIAGISKLYSEHKDDLEGVSSLYSEHKDDLEGVSKKYHQFSNTWKVLATIGIIGLVSIGGIIYSGVGEINTYVKNKQDALDRTSKFHQKQINDIAQKTKQGIEDSLQQVLDESVVIARAAMVVSNKVDQQYDFGIEINSQSYLDDALRNLYRLISLKQFDDIRSFRVEELYNYVLLYRHGTFGRIPEQHTEIYGCNEKDFRYSRMKVSKGIYNWSVGNYKAAFDSLKTSWDSCKLPENRFLYFWLYSTLTKSTIDKFKIDDIDSDSNFDLSSALDLQANHSPLIFEKWMTLIATKRLYHLQNIITDPELKDKYDDETFKRLEAEATTIAEKLGLKKPENYKESFARIYADNKVDFRVKYIAAHYLHYLDWVDSNAPYNYHSESNAKYVSHLVNILANWPSFTKVKNNLVDRFHPCMLKSKPLESKSNSLCNDFNGSVKKQLDNAPYFYAIEDFYSWLDYLNEFYSIFESYDGLTLNHSLLVAYANLKEFNQYYEVETKDSETVDYNYNALLKKVCFSPVISNELESAKVNDSARFSRILNQIDKAVGLHPSVNTCTKGCEKVKVSVCKALKH